ncbi:unnamed protein product [Sympodiomycopsis kandeliae]
MSNQSSPSATATLSAGSSSVTAVPSSASSSSPSATSTSNGDGNGSTGLGTQSSGSTPLSVFYENKDQMSRTVYWMHYPQEQCHFQVSELHGPQFEHHLVPRQAASSSSAAVPDQPNPDSTSSAVTGPPVSSTSSTSAPSSTNSSDSNGNSGGGGNNSAGGLWSTGTNFPIPFLAFAIIAIALFVVVVAFVLLRICMRNRRLRRMGVIPDGPFDRFLGGGNGPLGLREVEDSQSPPRLWEAKIVPVPVSMLNQQMQQHQQQQQDPFPSSKKTPSSHGWDQLMPIAASLPSSLYTVTGASSWIKEVENNKDNKKSNETDQSISQQDLQERIPGSVNVSVFISMPSPPKSDGEELPELMIGTAAIPIYSKPIHNNNTATSEKEDYFNPSTTTSNSASANKFYHPTREELLNLYKVARQVKSAKAVKRQTGTTTESTNTQEQDTNANANNTTTTTTAAV